ncbi:MULTISPECIES: hypothetical protein [unclassified Variovorax]|nr:MULTISPECIES: hypothetical protein [unclassified Variovorax]KWT98051.1 hypothetical protein APY03_0722 [Variovorax sp. WDL1]
MHRAFIDTALHVALRGGVSEVECLDHMREWAGRLEQAATHYEG